MTRGALAWICDVVVIGMLLLGLGYRERRQIPIRALLPGLIWTGYLAIALANRSHQLTPLGWAPRAHWIRWLPRTVDPAHTLADAQLLLPALFEAALVTALLRTPRVTRFIWGAISVNGFILAAVGALLHFAGSRRMLGFIPTPEPTYFFATFFYKNHWAAYGALATVASLTLALLYGRESLRGGFKARGRMLFFTSIGVLTAITLPLPGSRAGVLYASGAILGFIAGHTHNWRATSRATLSRGRGAQAGLLLLCAGIVSYGVYAYLPRATEDVARTTRELKQSLAGQGADLRLLVSRDTLRMAEQRPGWGWGPGCFELVFPLFQGAYLRDAAGQPTARFEFAHDDWAQMLAEDGLLGLLILTMPLLITVRTAWRRSDGIARLAVAGCGMVALHALIDFPLHNPAVLLLWIVMLSSAKRLSASRDLPAHIHAGAGAAA